MKKWMCICAAVVLTVSALIGCGASAGAATIAARTEMSKEETSKTETAKKEITKTSGISERVGDVTLEETQTVAEKHHMRINVKDCGTISVKLHEGKAPVTAANFLKLAKDGLYDGPTLHRTISGFMTQGGDSLGTGMGGSDQEIEGGSSNSGMGNPLSHTRGVISMARSRIKDSANSQFFIVHEDNIFLDRDYVCLGYATEGMEVVGVVCEDTRVEDNSGSVAKANQPAIEDVKAVD